MDAVFLGGDMTEKGASIERLLKNMTLAASVAPVYAVHGNHDYRANISLVDNIIREAEPGCWWMRTVSLSGTVLSLF